MPGYREDPGGCNGREHISGFFNFKGRGKAAGRYKRKEVRENGNPNGVSNLQEEAESQKKVCPCGEDLSKAKRSARVRYWIAYRVQGKQKRESVGFSLEEAKAAEGKRRAQKKEGRIFDMLPEAKMTFRELTEWYLSIEKRKTLKYYSTLKINLNSFNAVFGNTVVGQLKPVDLENYQAKRKAQGYSDSYIDQEIGAARTMVNKAFENDLVGGGLSRFLSESKSCSRGMQTQGTAFYLMTNLQRS
jgi:hypothetical protein